MSAAVCVFFVVIISVSYHESFMWDQMIIIIYYRRYKEVIVVWVVYVCKDNIIFNQSIHSSHFIIRRKREFKTIKKIPEYIQC